MIAQPLDRQALGLAIGRVSDPEINNDGVAQVAAPVDLLSAKLKVLLQRAERKDYLDVATLPALCPGPQWVLPKRLKPFWRGRSEIWVDSGPRRCCALMGGRSQEGVVPPGDQDARGKPLICPH